MINYIRHLLISLTTRWRYPQTAQVPSGHDASDAYQALLQYTKVLVRHSNIHYSSKWWTGLWLPLKKKKTFVSMGSRYQDTRHMTLAR